eukprot:COSAG06_NODE_14833_length_1122_cov_0.831867_2_plen_35_part_01
MAAGVRYMYLYLKASFYQDRLGTTVGKVSKKIRFS